MLVLMSEADWRIDGSVATRDAFCAGLATY
jgi:hypothetical protein